MASRRRRGGRRNKPNSHWDVDLKQLEMRLRVMDANSREFKGSSDVFMAARWQSVQQLQEADDNSDHLIDTGEWIAWWLSEERGDHKMLSEEVCRKIFSVKLDKKNRGRVPMSDIDKFGKMCQRTWRELSSRGLGAALKKYSWFDLCVHQVVDEPEEKTEEPVKNLEEENRELTALVEELEDTVDTLRDTVNQNEESTDYLRQQLADTKAEFDEKDKKIAQQQEEIDRLVTEIQDGQAAFAEELKRTREHMDEQAVQHQAQQEESDRKIAELQRELAEALENGKIPEHFCNIPGHTDAMAELEQLREELEEAAKMIGEVEQEKNDYLERIRQLEASNQEKDQRIADLEAQLREAADRMAQKDAEHAEEKEKLQERIRELEPLQDELERAKETIDEKDNEIEELKKLLAQKDDQIEESKKINDDLQQSNDKLAEELAALKHELAEKNEEIEALSSSSGDAAARLEEIIARRDDEVANLTQELEALKHQLNHSRDAANEMERTKNAEIHRKDDEIHALRDALETQRTLNESLQAEIRRMQDVLANINKSSEEKQTIVINLEQTIVELRAELSHLRQENILLVARVEENQDNGANMQTLQEFEKEISYRDGRIAELERQLDRAQSRMKRASVMVQHVQTARIGEDHDQKLSALQEELNEAVNKADNAQRILETQPIRQNAVLWRQLGAKTVEIEKLQRRIQNLERMLELSEQRRDELDDAFNKQMGELSSRLNLSREESRGNRIAMEAELKSLKNQRDALREEQHDLHKYYELKLQEILGKLKKQQQYCAQFHGVELRDRVSQVRFHHGAPVQSRDSKESDATIPSIAEELDEVEVEESGPEQKPSQSMTITEDSRDAINLSILDLERVLVEGNYKVGILPSEIFCCGILCCGADWYCCSRTREARQPPSKRMSGQ